jgi:hypothetical protein
MGAHWVGAHVGTAWRSWGLMGLMGARFGIGWGLMGTWVLLLLLLALIKRENSSLETNTQTSKQTHDTKQKQSLGGCIFWPKSFRGRCTQEPKAWEGAFSASSVHAVVRAEQWRLELPSLKGTVAFCA